MRPRTLGRLLPCAVVFVASGCTSGAAGGAVPQAVIEVKQAECDDALSNYRRYAEKAQDLTGGLMLVPILCYRSAYNYSYIFFAADSKTPAKACLLSFKRPDGDGFKSAYDLVNYEYDADAKTMSELSQRLRLDR